MANEEIANHGHNGHGVEFEREDLSTRAVFGFMIGLAVTGVLIYFIIIGMYSFLDKYEREQAAAATPLAKGTDVTARYIPYAPGHGDYVEQKFKENGAPMLEYDEKGQFQNYLMNQEKELNSYGWVDEKAGVAHIPIEQAMKLIVKQGLPVKPEGGSEQKGAANQTPPKQKEQR